MMDNRNNERHEMILQETHVGGAEEWYCPVCGRRFLMQWPPNFKRIVLECGDENAIHTGSKDSDASPLAAEEQIGDPIPVDEWQTAIDEIDLMGDNNGELPYEWDVDPYEVSPYDDGDGVADFDFNSLYAEQEESGLSVEMMEALAELDFTVLDRLDEE